MGMWLPGFVIAVCLGLGAVLQNRPEWQCCVSRWFFLPLAPARTREIHWSWSWRAFFGSPERLLLIYPLWFLMSWNHIGCPVMEDSMCSERAGTALWDRYGCALGPQ